MSDTTDHLSEHLESNRADMARADNVLFPYEAIVDESRFFAGMANVSVARPERQHTLLYLICRAIAVNAEYQDDSWRIVSNVTDRRADHHHWTTKIFSHGYGSKCTFGIVIPVSDQDQCGVCTIEVTVALVDQMKDSLKAARDWIVTFGGASVAINIDDNGSLRKLFARAREEAALCVAAMNVYQS
jgi:hypothetical protein